MKIRLPQNVSVEFTKKVRNMDLRVAPLMFISLVENAFKHGISTTEPSFVNLSIETDIERVGDSDVRDFLIFRITNSNFPKTQEDRSGHGIGLQQVQRRLDLAYPNRYEWAHAISDDGKVYSSTIKIKL
jgi:sensor histidine kinase YesM